MANRFKGELAIEIEGKAYTLVMDFNAMAEFEEATGGNALDFLDAVSAGKAKIRELRAFVYAAMLARHPDATLQEAGNILSVDHNILADLIVASVPEASEVAVGNGKAPGRKGPRRA